MTKAEYRGMIAEAMWPETILRKARQIMEDPARWNVTEGKTCKLDDQVCAHCAVRFSGPLTRFFGRGLDHSYGHARQYLCIAASEFFGHGSRELLGTDERLLFDATPAEVLGVFDRAIELALARYPRTAP